MDVIGWPTLRAKSAALSQPVNDNGAAYGTTGVGFLVVLGCLLFLKNLLLTHETWPIVYL